MKALPKYPADHKVGMRVPINGSCCLSCEYLKDRGRKCGQKLFIQWNGSDKLPFPANEYCCDFYEPIDGAIRRQTFEKFGTLRVASYLEGLTKKKEQ